MSVRISFGDLSAGARFHTGKFYGMGARSHVQNWLVLEKETSGKARVVEVHGDPRQGQHVGAMMTPHRMTRVFPVEVLA